MEITISKQSLVNSLGKTFTIADRKSSMQILSNVLIEAQSAENVRIAATDLSISASSVFPAQINKRGALTVPAKTFYDIVRNMPEGMISVRTEDDQVCVSSGRADFKLLSLPAEDFPQLPSTSTDSSRRVIRGARMKAPSIRGGSPSKGSGAAATQARA